MNALIKENQFVCNEYNETPQMLLNFPSHFYKIKLIFEFPSTLIQTKDFSGAFYLKESCNYLPQCHKLLSAKQQKKNLSHLMLFCILKLLNTRKK